MTPAEIIKRLATCSSSDPNRKHGGTSAGKWRTVNVPQSLWDEVTVVAAQIPVPSRLWVPGGGYEYRPGCILMDGTIEVDGMIYTLKDGGIVNTKIKEKVA